MKVMHYPRLDTILMVENTLKELEEHPTRKELWTSLPKQVQYQTFSIILEYLVDSKKIIIDNRRIIWIFDPHIIQKAVEVEV